MTDGATRNLVLFYTNYARGGHSAAGWRCEPRPIPLAIPALLRANCLKHQRSLALDVVATGGRSSSLPIFLLPPHSPPLNRNATAAMATSPPSKAPR